MRFTLFSVLALGLSALADGSKFSSPKSGDQWSKGKSQMIMWDKSGMSSSCNIYLCPAGATDITTVISEIAVSVSNSGMYSWTPDSSISVSEAEIVVVDSEKVTIISSVFAFISSSGSYNGGGSYSYRYGSGSKDTKSKSYESKTMNLYTHETKTKTYDEYKGHETKTEESGSVYTSVVTVEVSGSYYYYTTASTSFTTVQVTTTVQGEDYTYAMTTSVPPPAAVTTEAATTEAAAASSTLVASVYYTTMASNSSTTLAVNATPTAITFTGAAPRSSSAFYSAAIGGLVGLAAMLLL